jgi:diaminohydroxyphosphoribosylaminopyrimidine deaminase/5-amino-6-(5-phosphoribosylamino)uracil reductase
MKIALQRARLGVGLTSPNPRVGAVVVKNGGILATGHHRAFGSYHAEREALAKIPGDMAKNATLYVTLEPCCHRGKTPPCTAAIKEAGIRRVVYGIRDPNPQVNGKGIRELREAGIQVDGPVLEEEACEINRGYFKYRRTGRPWVTIKFAQSIDGRIAASTGDSRWISGEDSLKLAHRLRAESDAVLVGINTALIDNPQLNVRFVRGRNPYRVVFDPNLRTSPNLRLFDIKPQPVYIATRSKPNHQRMTPLVERGAEFIEFSDDQNGDPDIGFLLDKLCRKGILYLLVEGGAQTLSSFIRGNYFDEIVAVTAPILIGGDGVPSVASLGVTKVNQALRLLSVKRKTYGRDLVVWYRKMNQS